VLLKDINNSQKGQLQVEGVSVLVQSKTFIPQNVLRVSMNFKTPHTTVQITTLSTPALITVGNNILWHITR
jgi:hypothetical protein